ncbi:MAG: TonB-dependent receptor [Acidobacteria bacterium]|nr:TonB-dependent receptor [Candidatus Sulfomarinibacter kjeldsenii]
MNDDLVFQNTFFYFTGDGYFQQFKNDRWFPEYGLDPFPGPGGEIIDTTDLVRRREVTEWDAGWIPNLQWSHGGGRGSLQAGAAIRLHSGRHFGTVQWAQYYPPDLPPDHRYYDYELDKTSLQPFLQENWHFNQKWNLLAGLTWTSHKYEMHNDKVGDVAFDSSFSYLLPRLGLAYHPSQRWSIYGNVSRGGREPAFRDLYDPQDFWAPPPQELEPEKLTDFELGARYSWKNGGANLNVYYLDFDNAIVWAGGLDNNGNPVTAVENIWGGGTMDHSGNSLPVSPEWLGTLELRGGAGPVDGFLQLRFVDDFYLDNTEDMRKFPEINEDPDYINRINPAYTVLDLGLEADLGRAVANLLSARRVALKLRVNNLTDQLFTTFGYFDGYQPVWIVGATRNAYLGVTFDW